MRTVGRRSDRGDGWADQGRLVRTAGCLRAMTQSFPAASIALNQAGARYLLIGGFAVIAQDAETIERDGVTIALASPATLIKLKKTARPHLKGVLAERESRNSAQ